jgi:hypothetical protein
MLLEHGYGGLVRLSDSLKTGLSLCAPQLLGPSPNRSSNKPSILRLESAHGIILQCIVGSVLPEFCLIG